MAREDLTVQNPADRKKTRPRKAWPDLLLVSQLMGTLSFFLFPAGEVRW
ncbi:MAG: hypothetical protein M2R45_04706 [Verrucomicrobia subdivision 3 bacterium]|nr:hypothetical protein [Limisphaerales bacterium]